LVVMSACHAGKRAVAGRGMAELAGDDLFGLQGAFFSAGARAVIGALWKADDATAADLMHSLHAGLAAGLAPELALQAAVKSYLAGARGNRRRNLYFWAPYAVSVFGRVPQSSSGVANR
ncbi:MAG: CHAT domain-containing protein, partial [Caldilineales bacterium]